MSENMKLCSNCDTEILESKFILHEPFCLRNVKKCAICREVINIEDEEDHITEHHSEVPCEFCKKKFAKDTIKDHIKNCDEKHVECQYCRLNIMIKERKEHEYICGSKTELCPICKKYIPIKDLDIHQDVGCYPEETLLSQHLDSNYIPVINARKNSKVGKIGKIAAASKLGLLNHNPNQNQNSNQNINEKNEEPLLNNKIIGPNLIKKEAFNKEREKQIDPHRELGEQIQNLIQNKEKIMEKNNVTKNNQASSSNKYKIDIGNNYVSSSNHQYQENFHKFDPLSNPSNSSNTKQIIKDPNNQINLHSYQIKPDVKKDIIKFKDSSNPKVNYNNDNRIHKEPVKDLHQLHNLYSNVTSNINKTKELIASKNNNLYYKGMIKDNYNFDTSNKDYQNLDKNKQGSSEKIEINNNPKVEIKSKFAKVGEIKTNVNIVNRPLSSNKNNTLLNKNQPSYALLNNLNQNKNKPQVINKIKQEVKKMPYTKHEQSVSNNPIKNNNQMKINLNSDKFDISEKENLGKKYIPSSLGNKNNMPENSKIKYNVNGNKTNNKNEKNENIDKIEKIEKNISKNKIDFKPEYNKNAQINSKFDPTKYMDDYLPDDYLDEEYLHNYDSQDLYNKKHDISPVRLPNEDNIEDEILMQVLEMSKKQK